VTVFQSHYYLILDYPKITGEPSLLQKTVSEYDQVMPKNVVDSHTTRHPAEFM
jgi:hypothetical protein